MQLRVYFANGHCNVCPLRTTVDQKENVSPASGAQLPVITLTSEITSGNFYNYYFSEKWGAKANPPNPQPLPLRSPCSDEVLLRTKQIETTQHL